MRYQVRLLLRFKIGDYFTITGIVWGIYLIYLIPFMLFWVGIDWDTFIVWLRDGTILQMIFTYPMAKIITKLTPKITLYWQTLSDKHG